jgi:single-stranded DNA-binding protein
MSIDALVTGKLHAKPQARTGKSGKTFCTATVKAPVRPSGQQEGDAPPLCFVSVIAFDEAAVSTLLALEAGDAVSLAGEITPKVYHPKDGGEPRASLDMVAQAVMSPYSVSRKRKAAAGEHQGDGQRQEREPRQGALSPWPQQGPEHPAQQRHGAPREPFNDPIPF